LSLIYVKERINNKKKLDMRVFESITLGFRQKKKVMSRFFQTSIYLKKLKLGKRAPNKGQKLKIISKNKP